jgi:hypothetical protein
MAELISFKTVIILMWSNEQNRYQAWNAKVWLVVIPKYYA